MGKTKLYDGYKPFVPIRAFKGYNKWLEVYQHNISFDKLSEDAKKFTIDSQTYYTSYPHFIEYFKKLESITKHNLIIGINFTYGWMPTTFKFKSENPDNSFRKTLAILNQAKKAGGVLNYPQIETLKQFFNNSLVGTSKLLHFVCPKSVPIWDSNVYRYITGTEPYDNSIGDIEAYMSYVEFCYYITAFDRYTELHRQVEAKVGHPISKFRSVELIMYYNGRKSFFKPKNS